MREILYKAKRTDNGEWVEGDLVHSVYKINDVCVGKYGSEIGIHQVDPETICQYTGLTDKNGNKIWENDICYADLKRPYAVVEFRNGCFVYNLNDGGEDYYHIMLPLNPLYSSDKCVEVIGNIFDNPELLERD